MYSSAPTMSRTSSPANDPTLGLSTRSNVRTNASAVTGSFDGGEKRNPRRTVNTYVRPSADTVGGPPATSGTSLAPSGYPRSG